MDDPFGDDRRVCGLIGRVGQEKQNGSLCRGGVVPAMHFRKELFVQPTKTGQE